MCRKKQFLYEQAFLYEMNNIQKHLAYYSQAALYNEQTKKFDDDFFLSKGSPPRFVSLEEIMKAADGVTNMSLAHEIAVNNDFRFQKVDPPPSRYLLATLKWEHMFYHNYGPCCFIFLLCLLAFHKF